MKSLPELSPIAALAFVSLLALPAGAAPEADASGGASIGTDGADASGTSTAPRPGKDKRKDKKWIKRWAPERNMGEIGIYGGVILPSRALELFDADRDLPDQGFKRFKRVAPDFGVRVGYYPIRFFGLEAEGGAMLANTVDDQRATMWTVRGHVVAQLGLWSITPFVLIGASGLGVSSDRAAVGNDIDLGLHFGGGLKFFLSRYVMLRLDVRDVVTAQRGVAEGLAHSPEILGGLSITLGRKDKKKTGPVDTDGDGIMDPDDQCINEPETKNNYLDTDGCPDEVPKEIERFTGVIQGIFFDTNKASIKPTSRKTLDDAVEVLKKFDSVRVEISGHTDSSGKYDLNVDLSARRAEAVKKYMTDAGVDAGRIETRGAGPDEPIADNKTKAGKAKNRRIEFKLLSK